MQIIYTTFPDEQSARDCIDILLNEKLIACANLWLQTAFYVWDDQKHSAPEVSVFLKILEEKAPHVRERLVEMHPYDTPCILGFPVTEPHPAYLDWVRAQVQR